MYTNLEKRFMEVSMMELREIKDLLKKLVELLENEKSVNPPN